MTHLTARLEACRDKLEIAQDHKFDQGRASELRYFIGLAQTAEAVVKSDRSS
jgi:hypothetical protein